MRTNDILGRIAYHIRAAKGGSGLSDEEVARLLGKHQSTVSHYLRHPERIAVATFLDLCEVYGVDSGEILTRSIEEARAGG